MERVAEGAELFLAICLGKGKEGEKTQTLKNVWYIYLDSP